jgi:hypothetical protein
MILLLLISLIITVWICASESDKREDKRHREIVAILEDIRENSEPHSCSRVTYPMPESDKAWSPYEEQTAAGKSRAFWRAHTHYVENDSE